MIDMSNGDGSFSGIPNLWTKSWFGGIWGTNLCASIISMEEQHKVHTRLQQFVTDETLHHLPQFVLFKMQTLSSQYTINSGMAMIIDL